MEVHPPIVIKPGIRKDDPGQARATQTLLRLLNLRPRQAATIAGVSERDLALLLSGHAHVEGRCRWDYKQSRWVGGWSELARRLIKHVDPEFMG